MYGIVYNALCFLSVELEAFLFRLILWFLVFSSLIIRAESADKIFNNEIPETVKSNALFLKSVTKNIERYGRLDPGLIYPFLEYLRLKYDARIADRDNNFLWYLNARINERLRQRARWIEKTKERLKNFPDGKKYTGILEGLNLYINQKPVREQLNSRPGTYDFNREYFMAALYLGQRAGKMYDKLRNYRQDRDSLWQKKVRLCREVYETLKSPDLYSDEIKEKAVKGYLLVFQDSYLRDISKVSFTLSDFLRARPEQSMPDRILTVVRKYLRGKHEQKMAITAGYPGKDLNVAALPVQNFTDPFGSTFDIYLNDRMVQKKAPWQVGVTIALRQYTGLFSYLRINYGYAENQYSFSGETLLSDTISYYQYPLYRITGRYYKTQKPSKTFRMTRVQLMVPLLYLNNGFILEAGGTLKKIRTTIHYGAYFDGTVAVYPGYELDDFFTATDYQDDADVTQYTIQPTVSFKYIFMEYLLLQADYHFNNENTKGNLILGINLRYPF